MYANRLYIYSDNTTWNFSATAIKVVIIAPINIIKFFSLLSWLGDRVSVASFALLLYGYGIGGVVGISCVPLGNCCTREYWHPRHLPLFFQGEMSMDGFGWAA